MFPVKREDILSGIKEAEANARSMIESAGIARESRVSQARLEAGRIVSKAEADARKQADAALEKAVSEIKKECDSLLQGGLKDIELYCGKARKNLPKARELLLKGFEEASSA